MKKHDTLIDKELFPPFESFPKEGITFLRQLKKNNNREWFAGHKAAYEEYVRLPMQCLLSSLRGPMADIASEIDIDPRKNIFRIYRDTRFSKNKAPYKTHVAAILHPNGHWESNAGFYVHIEPEGIYAGGGIYMPDGNQLKKIRKAIAERGDEFQSIVGGKKFKKNFHGLEGNKLQRAPLGYPVDHPMIEWLKYKQFYAGVEWKAERAQRARFVRDLVKVYEELLPLIRFLNTSLGR
jgi:uncharacterized protein (TIGR02453 family)